MSITLLAAGGIGSSATAAVTPDYPTTPAPVAGNLALLQATCKPHTLTIDTPTGYQALTNYTKTGGTGSDGADTGLVRVALFVRVCDGTEGVEATVSTSGGTQTLLTARIDVWGKAAAATWDVALCNGSDDTGGSTTISFTMNADPGIKSGDMLVARMSVNSDMASFSGSTLTATGATIGAGTESYEHGTSVGNDGLQLSVYFPVTAGTGSAAPVFTTTASSSAAGAPVGACVVVRLRELYVPVAEFSGDVLSGDAPLTVDFTDASTNTPTSWAWDFDNSGSTDATSQNPSHTYATPGVYSVKLTATNADGSDVETKVNYITVTAPLEAEDALPRWDRRRRLTMLST